MIDSGFEFQDLRYLFLYILIGLIILDGITTYFGVVEGNAVERNIFMRHIMSTLGEVEALVATTVFSIIAILLLNKVTERLTIDSPVTADAIVVMFFPFMIGLYFFVIVNNVSVLIQIY